MRDDYTGAMIAPVKDAVCGVQVDNAHLPLQSVELEIDLCACLPSSEFEVDIVPEDRPDISVDISFDSFQRR